MNKTITETYLPVFRGFYGSFWEDTEYIEDAEIRYAKSELHLSDNDIQNIEFNYTEYFKELSERIFYAVYEELEALGYIKSAEFEDLKSPKYYNYSNDSIDVIFTLNRDNKRKIKDVIYNNMESFKDFIKSRYTSGPGFISYYSNNHNEWLNELDSCFEDEHKLGALLDFVCEIEEITEEFIYYEVEQPMITSNIHELSEGLKNDN